MVFKSGQQEEQPKEKEGDTEEQSKPVVRWTWLRSLIKSQKQMYTCVRDYLVSGDRITTMVKECKGYLDK